jgi:hypothetical protein
MGLVRLDLTSAAFRPTSETHSWTDLRAREGPIQLTRAFPAFGAHQKFHPGANAWAWVSGLLQANRRSAYITE